MSVATSGRLQPGMLLPELVATRGLAAVWVVLAHTLATVLRGHADLPAPVEYTRLVVDFFFVLSGFVLAHVYDPAWRAGRFRYFDFLGRRLTRLWPLHAATLCAVAVMLFAGRMAGVEPESPHTTWTFLATLLMLHAAWTTPDLAWNWPSWSVAAEWSAYLAIPLFFLAADRIRGTAFRLFVMLATFAACSAFAHLVLGDDLTSLTFDGGALRIVPSFLAGILLRRIFDDEPRLTAMTPVTYAAIVAGVFAVCVALVIVRAPYDALWPPMIVLVAALASRATWTKPGVLRSPALVWLGDLSYAIYLTHALVLTALFSGAELFGLADTLGQRAALGAAVPFVTVVASWIAYVTVEKPGRVVMARIFHGKQPRSAAPPAPAPGGRGVVP